MREKIYRLRLRTTGIPKSFPYRIAYLVPEERTGEIFRLFGMSFSAAVSTLRELPKFEYTFDVDRQLHALGLPRYETDLRAVVPLQVYPPTGAVKSFYSTRHAPNEPAPEALHSEMNLEEMRKAIPPTSATLHLGPAPEDSMPLCNCCSRLTDHFMGLCTPGLRRCTWDLRIPAKYLNRKARHEAETPVPEVVPVAR